MRLPPGALRRLSVTAALVLPPAVWSMMGENTVLIKSWLLGFFAAILVSGLGAANPVFTARFMPLNALFLMALGHAALSVSMSFAVSSLVPLFTLWILAAGSTLFPSGRLKWVITFALVPPAVIGAAQIAGLDLSPWQAIVDGHFHGRICATLGNPNFFAAFIVAALPFSVWGFVASPSAAARAACGAVFCIGLLDLLHTGSKGGMIGAAAAALVFAIAVRRFRSPAGGTAVSWRWLLAGATAVTIAGLLFMPSSIRSRLFFATPEDAFPPGTPSIQRNESVRFRQLTWIQVLRMARDAPVLGHGIGRFQVVYPRYRVPEIIRMFGQHSYMTDHPENITLEILAELGLLGLGLWAWLLVTIGMSAWRKLGCAGAQTKWFAAAGSASLAGIFMTNSLGVDAHYGATAPMAACIAAMLIAKTRSKTAVDPAPAGIARFATAAAGVLLFLAWTRINTSDAYMGRAIAYSQRNDWDKAIAGYRSSGRLNPFNVMNRYFMASAFLDRGGDGDLAEAERLFASVRNEAPDYVLLNYKLALMYNRQGRQGEAKAALDRQIELDPLAAVFYLDRGRMAIEEGRREDAGRNFETAIKVEPGSPSGYQFLGNLLVLEKRYGEALEIYGQGLMRNPGSVELHYNAAVAAYRMGRRELARSHALTVLESEPGHVQARRILEEAR